MTITTTDLFLGDDGMLEYAARVNRKPAHKPVDPSQTLIDRFRIYFPTDKTVRTSRGGRGVSLFTI